MANIMANMNASISVNSMAFVLLLVSDAFIIDVYNVTFCCDAIKPFILMTAVNLVNFTCHCLVQAQHTENIAFGTSNVRVSIAHASLSSKSETIFFAFIRPCATTHTRVSERMRSICSLTILKAMLCESVFDISLLKCSVSPTWDAFYFRQ